MLTDKLKLIELLEGFGVKLRKEPSTVTLEVNKSDPDSKISGYMGFFTEFNFDENGKFIDVGVWE